LTREVIEGIPESSVLCIDGATLALKVRVVFALSLVEVALETLSGLTFLVNLNDELLNMMCQFILLRTMSAEFLTATLIRIRYFF
jgi:hypothetical protein